MTITVQIKSHYGTQFIYPVCDAAQKLCALTGKKTLSQKDIGIIKYLGYSIEVQQPEITL